MELLTWFADLFMHFVDFVLHLDAHLVELLRDYGNWIYLILFAIVFAETGFVITPFLPGDSLLFAAGALAAVDTSDTFRIDLAWTVTQTAPLWKYPVIVFEQTARYTGRLQQKVNGNWQTVAKFDEPGFCEYTSLWYEPT